MDYTAIVFTSRMAIDAFFQLCEELRVKVPETMKYFCSTEAVANYLQKHIVYRKRKIFFGNGTPEALIALVGPKHKGDKFLVATSAPSGVDSTTKLFEANGLDYTPAIFVKSVSQDLTGIDLHKYDMLVVFNPSDVKSLFESYPDFKQENIKFLSYGRSIVSAMKEAGLTIEIEAPTADAPSVSKALENYLSANK